jgi:uncharacterized protein YndB with AHSA1/START domain
MASILHDFEVNAEPSKVYEAITTPAGLDQWWTRRARGEPRVGEEYELWFGPEYDWRAKVTEAVPSRRFALEMTGSDVDWMGTQVAFTLEPAGTATRVRFSHGGWRSENEHFRTSSYCWAMYLRIMRRFAEVGETVPYEDRINV